MKQELDNQLCEKYPKIFKDRYADPKETLMCWGFECGDGWYNIIDQLCSNIQHHIDWKKSQHDRDIKYNEMVQSGLAGNLELLEDYYKGWLNAEERISEALERGPTKVTELVPQLVAVQVKEKFGTLRFYTSGGDDIIYGMIRMAESMSGVTCEDCGNPGKTGGKGWIRTICKSCENQRDENLRNRSTYFGNDI